MIICKKKLISEGHKRYVEFSWQKSATLLLEEIKEYIY